MSKRSYRILLAALALVLIAAAAVSLVVGRYALAPQDVAAIISAQFVPVETTWSGTEESVLMTVRIPRLIMGILVGAGLSVAGAAFQTMFKNPLVSPDILGVSASAGFGAAIGIMISDTLFGLTSVLAFAFGIIGVACTYAIGRVRGASPTVTLVLAGIVVTALANAGISLMKTMADPLDKLPAITFWLMGSLSSSQWEDVAVSLPIVIVCSAVLYALGWRMNLLTMGDAEARSMGVRPARIKKAVIACATLISATCVCACGSVGWVGLVIPHVARMIVGPDMRRLVPASFLMGGIFLLVVDTVTRTATEASLPLSIVTALIGAPFFAVLIRRSKGGWD